MVTPHSAVGERASLGRVLGATPEPDHHTAGNDHTDHDSRRDDDPPRAIGGHRDPDDGGHDHDTVTVVSILTATVAVSTPATTTTT